MYDVTVGESFHNVKKWLGEIDRYAGGVVNRLLVGNKCDLEENRAVPYETAKVISRRCTPKNLYFCLWEALSSELARRLRTSWESRSWRRARRTRPMWSGLSWPWPPWWRAGRYPSCTLGAFPCGFSFPSFSGWPHSRPEWRGHRRCKSKAAASIIRPHAVRRSSAPSDVPRCVQTDCILLSHTYTRACARTHTRNGQWASTEDDGLLLMVEVTPI